MPIISASQLVAQTPPTIAWMVPNLLISGGLNLIAGEVAAGKTFLALDLALGAAARGEAWGGLPVMRGNVLYFCLDSSPQTIGHRLNALCRGYGITAPKELVFDFDMHAFNGADEMDALQTRIEREDYRLVIIDVLVRYLPGMLENAVATVGPLLAGLREIASTSGTTFVLVHHFNKRYYAHAANNPGLRIRGSSDIFASMDTAISLTHRGEWRKMAAVKNRMGKEEEGLYFRILKQENGSIKLDFSSPEEEEQTPSSLVELGLTYAMKILYAKAGNYFTRDVLEDLLKDFMNLPSERTMDDVFAQLADQPGVRTVRRGLHKFYGYIPQATDEDAEENQGQKTANSERLKKALAKALQPRLEKMKREMWEKALAQARKEVGEEKSNA
ncbi:MAG: AAA family ATPase [Chloroflexota bacterium]